MRNITTASLSFVLGAACMFLLGNHASTFVHPASAQAELLVDAWKAAVPVVPPLNRVGASHNTQIGGEYGLDGIETSASLFNGVTFVYGGGAYKMDRSAIVGPVNLRLIGAAANTAQLLASLGLLGGSASAPTSPPATEPNTPRVERTAKTTIKGDFVSPYSGHK
jgi:hypothetical protein